jgi:hypothetical protein
MVHNEKNYTIKEGSIEVQIDEKPLIPCFNFKWPYVCYESIISNHIIIINCEEQDVIHNVELGKNIDKINNTFITDQNELYVMAKKQGHYVLFKINLDLSVMNKNNSNETKEYSQPFRPFEILRYNAKSVNHHKLLRIWVRGSS